MESLQALRKALKDALTELHLVYANLTAAQEAGTRLQRRVQELEAAAGLRRDDSEARGVWTKTQRPIRCGFPDGRSGVTCQNEAQWVRVNGAYLYACEAHAR
jgi:hypothetical protein